jgi:DNA repair exonuclease SbcCD ATPase subunit
MVKIKNPFKRKKVEEKLDAAGELKQRVELIKTNNDTTIKAIKRIGEVLQEYYQKRNQIGVSPASPGAAQITQQITNAQGSGNQQQAAELESIKQEFMHALQVHKGEQQQLLERIKSELTQAIQQNPDHSQEIQHIIQRIEKIQNDATEAEKRRNTELQHLLDEQKKVLGEVTKNQSSIESALQKVDGMGQKIIALEEKAEQAEEKEKNKIVGEIEKKIKEIKNFLEKDSKIIRNEGLLEQDLLKEIHKDIKKLDTDCRIVSELNSQNVSKDKILPSLNGLINQIHDFKDHCNTTTIYKMKRGLSYAVKIIYKIEKDIKELHEEANKFLSHFSHEGAKELVDEFNSQLESLEYAISQFTAAIAQERTDEQHVQEICNKLEKDMDEITSIINDIVRKIPHKNQDPNSILKNPDPSYKESLKILEAHLNRVLNEENSYYNLLAKVYSEDRDAYSMLSEIEKQADQLQNTAQQFKQV